MIENKNLEMQLLPSWDFTYTWHAGNTYREQAVIGTYDLKEVKLEKRIKGNIPIEGLKWRIGVFR